MATLDYDQNYLNNNGRKYTCGIGEFTSFAPTLLSLSNTLDFIIMKNQPRRQFLKESMTATVGMGCLPFFANTSYARNKTAKGMKFGLVTYLWGKDMDLPTLLDVCEKSGVLGVELRTQHAHGVEPVLSKVQRAEVRKRFADSPVELVGYGSNAQYHENDPAKLKANIALTKDYLRLMHDCGGSGVKVKPNGFVNDVPREKTIEQIGLALNEVAKNSGRILDNKFAWKFMDAGQVNCLWYATSSKLPRTPTPRFVGTPMMLISKVPDWMRILTWLRIDLVAPFTSVN